MTTMNELFPFKPVPSSSAPTDTLVGVPAIVVAPKQTPDPAPAFRLRHRMAARWQRFLLWFRRGGSPPKAAKDAYHWRPRRERRDAAVVRREAPQATPAFRVHPDVSRARMTRQIEKVYITVEELQAEVEIMFLTEIPTEKLPAAPLTDSPFYQSGVYSTTVDTILHEQAEEQHIQDVGEAYRMALAEVQQGRGTSPVRPRLVPLGDTAPRILKNPVTVPLSPQAIQGARERAEAREQQRIGQWHTEEADLWTVGGGTPTEMAATRQPPPRKEGE